MSSLKNFFKSCLFIYAHIITSLKKISGHKPDNALPSPSFNVLCLLLVQILIPTENSISIKKHFVFPYIENNSLKAQILLLQMEDTA